MYISVAEYVSASQALLLGVKKGSWETRQPIVFVRFPIIIILIILES
jgi:hypothetical protein